MSTEAKITINGRSLTEAQSLALRVACTFFQAEMSEPGALGDDDTAKRMSCAYRDRMSEIISLILQKSPE
ncbi:hypothetical protein [Hoeflea sp.]|uniref:hypothetical protein n=1 Tax=Hoeflea sp. TaxID=1940281 RepID=UPI003B52BFE3